MRRVALIYKDKDEKAGTLARKMAERLQARSIQVLAEPGALLPGATETPNPASVGQFAVVLGGDGTFLHAAGQLTERVVPLLGINMGTLGFLTPFGAGEAVEAVDRAVAGTLTIKKRMRLRVQVLRSGRLVLDTHAANDAVISQSRMARLLEISCSFDGLDMTTYRADGLIVSTPMGSTAYGLAAGGPIIEPAMEAVGLVPICPHHLTHRPLILHMESRLDITVTDPAYLTIDGQRGMEVGPEDTISVSKSHLPLEVFLPDGYSFFDVLTHKLNWGMRGGPSGGPPEPAGGSDSVPGA